MRVFIANFGQANYLWPECLRRSTIATVDNVGVHRFWENQDRPGFIDYALANMKTAQKETPTRSVASRWFGINDAIANTNGDTWIHREKEQLWWTVSRPEPMLTALMPSINPGRDGDTIYELHKPADPWSNRSKTGGQLSWTGLHPKARDFLFTEGTLQELQPSNAEYALALIAGDPLEPWHNQRSWREKAERTRKNPAVSYDARKKAIYRMVATVFNTVANANGQQVLRTVKDKRTDFHPPALEAYVSRLIDSQDGVCAITNIRLQFDGDEDDQELLPSLDRIDSDGHYEPGNLQVVCRFVNRWKKDSRDSEFRRLIALTKATAS